MPRRLRRVYLDLSAHFLTTAVFCYLIYSKTNQLLYVFLFILGSIFIDLDHFIDYFLFFGFKFSSKDFLGFSYLASGKFYVFMHSWEISLIFLVWGIICKSFGLFIFSLGLSTHLAIDNIQRRNKLAYFLTYRMIKNFNCSLLMPELDKFFKK